MVARQRAAQNPGQGGDEVGMGLQAQVKVNPASWPGLGQGRSRDICPVFYYTVKNSAQWLCGHEGLTKGVDTFPAGNSSPGRSIR